MQKTARIGRNLSLTLKNWSIHKRCFLSEAYRCQEAWDRRFESPILQNIDPATLFFDVGQKFRTVGKANVVDIDIFANIIKSDSHGEELANMLKGLRSTTETTSTLDSTHHATIRYLLDQNKKDLLFEILHNRYQYGIFPDHLTYNLMMDTFIKQKDFASAAKVAVLLMLQEDSQNPISNALCVYSCHNFLKNPDEWQEPKVEEPNEDEEVTKIRVKYLRNPYFDDHFDLTNPRDLVGKTLAFQGKRMNDPLGRSCQLRGLILYKKYNAAENLIKDWLEKYEKDEIVYEEVFDLIENDNSYIPEDQISQEFKNLRTKLDELKTCKLSKSSMLETMENNIKTAVDEQSQKDIDFQLQAYIEWDKKRKDILEKQIADLNKQAALEEIIEIKKDLKEREMMLTFFEHEEDIELKIENLEKQEKEAYEKLRIENKKILEKLEEEQASLDITLRK